MFAHAPYYVTRTQRRLQQGLLYEDDPADTIDVIGDVIIGDAAVAQPEPAVLQMQPAVGQAECIACGALIPEDRQICK